MLLALFLACTPGTLDTAQGSEPLRTAFYRVERDPDGDEITLLLFNSYVPCALNAGDADERELALEALTTALLREGARVVYARIVRLPGIRSWEGRVEVYDEDDFSRHLDGLHPLGARVLYGGVNEAELDDEDGLAQTYTPTDITLAAITPPSWMEISRADDQLHGRMSLDDVDVAGHFHAEPCAQVDTIVAYAQTTLLAAAIEASDSEE